MDTEAGVFVLVDIDQLSAMIEATRTAPGFAAKRSCQYVIACAIVPGGTPEAERYDVALRIGEAIAAEDDSRWIAAGLLDAARAGNL